MADSEIRSRMQPLKDLLMNTIHHLHPVLDNGVFVAICRRFWDRMGQDLLHLLENRKENTSSYKGLRIAVSVRPKPNSELRISKSLRRCWIERNEQEDKQFTLFFCWICRLWTTCLHRKCSGCWGMLCNRETWSHQLRSWKCVQFSVRMLLISDQPKSYITSNFGEIILAGRNNEKEPIVIIYNCFSTSKNHSLFIFGNGLLNYL